MNYYRDPRGRDGGSIDFSAEHNRCECKPLIWARLLAVVIGLPVAWVLLVPEVPLPAWQAVVVVVGGTLMYVAAAYLVDPQPNLEDAGPLAGVIDDPYTRSDEVARFMMGLKCLLGPGRFIAESVLDAGQLFRDDPQEQEPS